MTEIEGTRMKELPAMSEFTGDKAEGVTPLEQFYNFAVDFFLVHGGRVFIDIQKIHISPEDCVLLYRSLLRFMLDLDPKEGGAKADVIWAQLAPCDQATVPIGHVVVEPGAVYIKRDRHVYPRVSH